MSKWKKVSDTAYRRDDDAVSLCMVRVGGEARFELRRAGATGRPISTHRTNREAQAAGEAL